MIVSASCEPGLWAEAAQSGASGVVDLAGPPSETASAPRSLVRG